MTGANAGFCHYITGKQHSQTIRKLAALALTKSRGIMKGERRLSPFAQKYPLCEMSRPSGNSLRRRTIEALLQL